MMNETDFLSRLSRRSLLYRASSLSAIGIFGFAISSDDEDPIEEADLPWPELAFEDPLDHVYRRGANPLFGTLRSLTSFATIEEAQVTEEGPSETDADLNLTREQEPPQTRHVPRSQIKYILPGGKDFPVSALFLPSDEDVVVTEGGGVLTGQVVLTETGLLVGGQPLDVEQIRLISLEDPDSDNPAEAGGVGTPPPDNRTGTEPGDGVKRPGDDDPDTRTRPDITELHPACWIGNIEGQYLHVSHSFANPDYVEKLETSYEIILREEEHVEDYLGIGIYTVATLSPEEVRYKIKYTSSEGDSQSVRGTLSDDFIVGMGSPILLTYVSPVSTEELERRIREVNPSLTEEQVAYTVELYEGIYDVPPVSGFTSPYSDVRYEHDFPFYLPPMHELVALENYLVELKGDLIDYIEYAYFSDDFDRMSGSYGQSTTGLPLSNWSWWQTLQWDLHRRTDTCRLSPRAVDPIARDCRERIEGLEALLVQLQGLLQANARVIGELGHESRRYRGTIENLQSEFNWILLSTYGGAFSQWLLEFAAGRALKVGAKSGRIAQRTSENLQNFLTLMQLFYSASPEEMATTIIEAFAETDIPIGAIFSAAASLEQLVRYGLDEVTERHLDRLLSDIEESFAGNQMSREIGRNYITALKDWLRTEGELARRANDSAELMAAILTLTQAIEDEKADCPPAENG
jgi:hypothetical protein